MPFGFPVMLELAGRRCVVIGSMAVREGKVEGLLAAGADDILVVDDRPWEPADLDGAFLCIASSPDPIERALLAREARDRGVLINVMDDIANCDWSAPAVVRRGELVLSVATGGTSPALAKHLRKQLSSMFGEEWAEVLTVLREVRQATMPSLPEFSQRARLWSEALDTDEAAALVRAGRAEELRARLTSRLLGSEPGEAGHAEGRVILVGAGPGDPDLITVRGAQTLGTADVVVYDRLASPSLLDLAPARAERVYVGKEPGRPALAQTDIDTLLVERAIDGATVVRLKGGDPFVFGRGGEELLACVDAGIPCEVVPGVTSAAAAPAAAGIPLTHRGLARSFAVVTGSTAHAEDTGDLERMATATDTLVVLMAAGKLADTCARLVAAGRRPDEPAAVIQWAWTDDQRAVAGTLNDLAGRAATEKIGPPATLIVGEVARMADASGPVTKRHTRRTAAAP